MQYLIWGQEYEQKSKQNNAQMGLGCDNSGVKQPA